MNSKLVSIVIPCYNASLFLPQTLNSIFSQTFQNFEIIAVDDGSTDSTLEILESYSKRIRYVSGPNQGASVARNSGTNLATGDFIQYLDADDLLLPRALEHKVAALEESKADVAYSDWQKLEERLNRSFVLGEIISRRLQDVHPDPEISLFTDFWSPPAALLYRRSIVDKIGAWNETLPIIQDARFFLDAALVGGTFVHVPETLAHYRVHRTSSLSKRNKVAFAIDCYTNTCQIEEIWQKCGDLTAEQKKALLKNYGQSARFLFEHDRPKFYEVLTRIRNIEPNYLPLGPSHLRWLSSLIGYENSEAIAFTYRRLVKQIRNYS
ncbi:glycosyltransferase [Moorena producens]|uniref:glycosyltransferase n=1 Tax=Moorena producens TaxID=1155739 RepID=UPI003C751C16